MIGTRVGRRDVRKVLELCQIPFTDLAIMCSTTQYEYWGLIRAFNCPFIKERGGDLFLHYHRRMQAPVAFRLEYYYNTLSYTNRGIVQSKLHTIIYGLPCMPCHCSGTIMHYIPLFHYLLFSK